MNNLVARSLSGVVYVSLIICSILFCDSWGFPLLCGLFAALATVEFHNLCEGGGKPLGGLLFLDILGVLSLVLAPSIAKWWGQGGWSVTGFSLGLICFLCYVMIRLIGQLYVKSESDTLRCMLTGLSGQLYVGVPLFCANMVFLCGGSSLALTMFLMIWLNDTGAYIVGCSIGRHRLFPRISPKKSWEGFGGGLVFCVLCAVVLRFCFECWSPRFTILAFCGYGLAAGIFATWGDLVESMIKRSVGVKDSGRIMPGHGGILDRIDSLLFVAPMTLIYYMIYMMC